MVCAFVWMLAAAALAQRTDEVVVPGGTFTMGTDASKVDALMARFSSKRRELFAAELPSHEVSLGALFVDRTEVTNAAFKAFVDAHREWSRERLPADRHNGDYLKTWTDGAYPTGEAELPVTFVGSFPPAHGLYDMAGNVWEFTADAWKDSYLDTANASPGRRVIRGGSFGGSPVNLRVRYRDSHPEPGAGPHVGFRCVRSMEAK